MSELIIQEKVTELVVNESNSHVIEETVRTVVLEIKHMGPAGARGFSAYDVAVMSGFVGTEAEWLESLKGAQGEPGVTTVSNLVNETLIGVPDQVLLDFELSQVPVSGSLQVYMNGLALTPGEDYDLMGTTVTFIEAPWPGDNLRASYLREV